MLCQTLLEINKIEKAILTIDKRKAILIEKYFWNNIFFVNSNFGTFKGLFSWSFFAWFPKIVQYFSFCFQEIVHLWKPCPEKFTLSKLWKIKGKISIWRWKIGDQMLKVHLPGFWNISVSFKEKTSGSNSAKEIGDPRDIFIYLV